MDPEFYLVMITYLMLGQTEVTDLQFLDQSGDYNHPSFQT